MANKRLFQFLYSKQPKLTAIYGGIQFGANGTVASGSSGGAGVYSVSKLATGVYQIKLQDNYAAVISQTYAMHSGVSAAEVNVASLTSSAAYQIAVVGNSTWSTVGLDADYTAAVGQAFVANNVAGSGTGTAKLLVPSGIDSVESLRNTSGLLTNGSPNLGKGSSILFQTLANQSSGSGVIQTMTPTNPVASSTMTYVLWYKDSSVSAL